MYLYRHNAERMSSLSVDGLLSRAVALSMDRGDRRKTLELYNFASLVQVIIIVVKQSSLTLRIACKRNWYMQCFLTYWTWNQYGACEKINIETLIGFRVKIWRSSSWEDFQRNLEKIFGKLQWVFVEKSWENFQRNPEKISGRILRGFPEKS